MLISLRILSRLMTRSAEGAYIEKWIPLTFPATLGDPFGIDRLELLGLRQWLPVFRSAAMGSGLPNGVFTGALRWGENLTFEGAVSRGAPQGCQVERARLASHVLTRSNVAGRGPGRPETMRSVCHCAERLHWRIG